MLKRPRRSCCDASAARGCDTTVADVSLDTCACTCTGLEPSLALTGQDTLEDSTERPNLFRGQRTIVVTAHTNERPKGLPRGTMHIGCYFEDGPHFDACELQEHLDRMVSRIQEIASTHDITRILFACNAGVNRSSLCMCYYVLTVCTCARTSWRATKESIVLAKKAAAKGWPTLVNVAFEAFLDDVSSRLSSKDTRASGDDESAVLV